MNLHEFLALEAGKVDRQVRLMLKCGIAFSNLQLFSIQQGIEWFYFIGVRDPEA